MSKKRVTRATVKLGDVKSELQEAAKEEEVRLIISGALGITSQLKVVGSTDGVWRDRLFEFKHDKKFHTGAHWNKSAYGALAQALYYCRRINNFEVDGVVRVPHTIIVCDKGGGFAITTKDFEGLLHHDPEIFAANKVVRANLQGHFGKQWLKFVNESGFSWDSPPSSQNEALVKLLQDRGSLTGIQYFSFNDQEQIRLFLAAVNETTGESPTISITKSNFVGIFGRWFDTFAPKGASRREWADRFVIDLRRQYSFDRRSGILKHPSDEWNVAVDLYDEFWKLYKRPPEEAVDLFIATNKDLLYDLDDQNNHGDFYTPIRLVNLAQRMMLRKMNPSKSKRLWWDPAAGGGNLFFRFNEAEKVILSTKFKADCDGLNSNPSVKASLIIKLDFVNDLLESDVLHQKMWKKILELAEKSDEIVMFMNPPFDDQAESRGTNESLPEGFLQDEDEKTVSARSLRALHTRFFYRILCLARTLEKPMWVAAFSKTAWVVGPDGETFYNAWKKSFNFVDGFLISSKVFNGVKAEWPCLFSLWHYAPKGMLQFKDRKMDLDVYDSSYNWLGKKTLIPFSNSVIRLSEISDLERVDLGSRDDYEVVAPLKNEFEVGDIVYDDKLPRGALGYLRRVANDVYNSTQRVQLYSSMCGPSNCNGVPIMEKNFVEALAVYGIRKSVRRGWLNDKDEFYLPAKLTDPYKKLLRKAAVFALVDSGYTSSLEGLRYEKQDFSFRNEFFIATRIELGRWTSKDLPDADSFASRWLRGIKAELTTVEEDAIKAAKSLIGATFKNNLRAKGDPERQLRRSDAGMRQIINGLLEFKGVQIPEELTNSYKAYLEAKEELRAHLEKEIYRLAVLLPFDESTFESTPKHPDKKVS